MIPILDIARLFVARGVQVTIITTTLNVPVFERAIDKEGKKPGSTGINIEVFTLPTQEAGLPEGCENLDQAMAMGIAPVLLKASDLLQDPLERFLEQTRPNCLVADMFFPWATDSAAKFNVPRLVFHGISLFALCAGEIVRLYEPYKNVSSDEEPFVLPYLPHEVKFTRLQLPAFVRNVESDFGNRIKKIKESEFNSYGVLVNSFYELEPDYAEFFGKELGRRAWHIGPVSLCNRSIEDKAWRGKQASLDKHECLNWLNSKKPNSVVYISFGSMANLTALQLHEIALALEAAGQDFIWVVRSSDGKEEEWLPQGFERRMEGKGLLIRGWAPQVLILEHEAVGAFVTHCGWNSTLEGISAGVPMVTWPSFAEQFYNEKLVTHVLKTGVSVGAKKWGAEPSLENLMKSDAIEQVVREIMVGEEAEERRRRAKKLQEMAWKAVEEGGSSYCDLTALINELRNYRA